MKLNILYILTDIYNKNQANNLFHLTLYLMLYSSFWEKDIISETSSFKLYN